MRERLGIGVALLLFACGQPAHSQTLGPTPYLSSANSPFNSVSFSYFHRETFEDHLLNTPGVSADGGGVTSTITALNNRDSVDADDGSIDGSGLNGDSYFRSVGSTGVRFTFNAGVLGSLPTHAGIVWTDGGGGPLSPITFEAFDQNGASLGVVTGNHADLASTGQTAEDRFYGAIHAGGISSIRLRNQFGGIEMDHLQYGRAVVGAAVPEPISAALFAPGLAALGLVRRRRGARRG